MVTTKKAKQLVTFLLLNLFAAVGFFLPKEAEAQTTGKQNLRAESDSKSKNPESWLVRDPRTGRLYRQYWQTVSTPTTQWHPKAIKETVYEPQYITTSFPSQQTVFVPQTKQVLHQKVVGKWNPFRQTAVQYKYLPVTSWVPRTQTVNVPVTSQRWAAREATTYRWEPQTKLVQQKQLVSTEVPQSNQVFAASSQPALINFPILKNQQPAPLRRTAAALARAWQPSTPQPVNPPPLPNPIAQATAASYSAPMRTAAAPSSSFSRDTMQAGMSATVLR